MFYCLNRIALTNHKDTQKIPFLQMFFSDGESRGISGVAGHICGEEFGVLHMCGGGSHFVRWFGNAKIRKNVGEGEKADEV